MLKKEIDIFREILLVIILIHYLLILYGVSYFIKSDKELLVKMCVCGILVLGLLTDYFLVFHMWVSVRHEKYIKGKVNTILSWTIALLIWSFIFLKFVHQDLYIIYKSGILLLIIYSLSRYKMSNYIEKKSYKYKQLKDDIPSLLFLSFLHLLLSGIVILFIIESFPNYALVLGGAALVSELILCYLNKKLLRKYFNFLNFFLLGSYFLMLVMKMIISVINDVYLRTSFMIMYILILILAWAFLVSKVREYESRIASEVND